GGTYSIAYDINNRGQAVGRSSISCDCAAHPFFWSGGTLLDLGVGGFALGINDRGQVVGTSSHAFLWSRETGMTALGFEGFASEVNNRTEIVGQMTTPSHAFYWKNGTLLDLGTLGGNGNVSGAGGINNRGQVVGQASGPGAPHAFVWTQSGGMRDL